jgi:hypothetical protein
MSGSYSSLAIFPGTQQYIFAWQSRGAIDLTQDSFLGAGYTDSKPRTQNHNVAISILKDKSTLSGQQATSSVGAASGDSQQNWVTQGSADHSNVHVATFNSENALVTWEEIANPSCTDAAMGCSGKFAGTFFQQIDIQGRKIGKPITAPGVYVSGDLVNIGRDRLCWPYVNAAWSLDKPDSPSNPNLSAIKKMSFACLSLAAGTQAIQTPTSSLPTGLTKASPSTTLSTVALPKSSISALSETSILQNPRTSATSTSSSADITPLLQLLQGIFFGEGR